jgi:menaquinone-9 beta-reductase
MSPSSTLHVAIVGAGPAGSSAATFLARQGARVTLLERHRFPRDKVCGDGCTPRTVWMLERLGLEPLPSSEASPVDSVYLASPGGRVLDAKIPAHIFGGRSCVVPRLVLDERLVRHAVRAGAELREGTKVEGLECNPQGVSLLLRGGERLRADVVLGCDGYPSVVRQALGAPAFPDNHSAYAVRAYYEGVSLSRPSAIALFWEEELLPAYGWIFPLPGGRANVGIGLQTDKLASASGKLPALLERFCASPRAAAELKGARRMGRVVGHPIPFGSYARHLVFDRALLLGDSAGFVNPLTGEGIEFALESGQFAAQALAEAEAQGDFSARGLAGYARRCEERFHGAFTLNRRLAWLFERPRLLDRIFLASQRSLRVQEEMAELLLGEAPRISWRLVASVALGG